MKTIGVLISGGGSNLQALIDGAEAGSIPARIGLVLSNRAAAYGLVRARTHGIPALHLHPKDFPDSEAYHRHILQTLKAHGVDLVVLAGYLRILSKELVEAYRHRIINVHPSLIPAFCGRGFYGEHVHRAVLDYGAKVTGATVHFVDEGADTGPILLQEPVLVLQSDDVKALAARVLKVEHALLCKAVSLLAQDRVLVEGRCVRIL
jgi:phosphoribosylglycinamide formyltransferase-1